MCVTSWTDYFDIYAYVWINDVCKKRKVSFGGGVTAFYLKLLSGTVIKVMRFDVKKKI